MWLPSNKVKHKQIEWRQEYLLIWSWVVDQEAKQEKKWERVRDFLSKRWWRVPDQQEKVDEHNDDSDDQVKKERATFLVAPEMIIKVT